MPNDKYSAVWVSSSSMSDFIKCPRLYYLRNVYKDPTTRHKINIISPALALGQSVHEVLEALSTIPAEKRFEKSLLETYEEVWKKVHGKLGGFANEQEEEIVKERGAKMLQRVIDHPGPLANKAIKIQKDLPNYYLSEEENIILCGKIDWLEYLPEDDSVNIIDFKTGKNDESASSLQLPIYLLLVHNLQKRKVSKASYWYLDRDDEPVEIQLPTLEEAHERVISTAKKVKEARLKGEYLCTKGGCFACRPFEKIIAGDAEFITVGGYSQDLYMIKN
ncbi:MAG TPA: PD-(D/E)XK nuclease family protein [Candidatus Saccharimonadales bacterium]|nr:PD-(D/E)XK nuclease family protein [Candidatus Saccharimonadales bacterium]